MKITRLIFLFLLSACTLFSCNFSKKNAETPENATTTFINAFYTGDFDELYNCTAKNNRPIIQQMQKTMNGNKEKLEQIRKNEVEIQDVQCTMQNDSVAECTCRFLFNKSPRKVTHNLRHENERWVVDLTINY